MKHITTTSLSLLCVGLGLAFSSLTSCKQEPPKLFDESALDRQEALSKELLTELTSSQHGWILEYYPQSQQTYGGYVMGLKFGGKNKVQSISESPVTDVQTDTWTSSDFHIKNDKGVTLSFDTYSLPIHIFSDPDKSYGFGEGKSFEGDYEFTLSRPLTPDTIYLRGRKTLTEMRLIRAKQDAKEYLSSVQALKSKAYTAETMYKLHLFGLEGTIGKKKVIAYLSEKGYNTMTVEEVDGGKKTFVPFICTPTGIRLYRPYEGITDLTWDDATKTYSSSMGDKLAGRRDPDYDGFTKYLGRYSMNCTSWSAPREVTFEQHARNIYAIKGIANGLTILAKYDPKNDRFEITTQKVLTGATTVYLAAWVSGGSLSWGEGYGMYSKADPTDPSGKRYILVDNGAWGNKCDSYILWVISKGRYTGFGGQLDFVKPTFTKL